MRVSVDGTGPSVAQLHTTYNDACAHSRPQSWNFDSFVAFFVVFNALPALLEVLMLVFVTKFSFLKY